MRRLRALPPSIAILLLSASVFAQSIPNWTAPPSWTSPRAAALERVLRSRPVGTMGIQDLPTGPLPLFGITPCRLADTRGNGFTGAYGPPALSQGSPRNFTLTGQCGIPGAAQAVSLNVTVTNTQGPGFILIYPQGGAQPNVSTLNYVAGQTIANAAVVPLGTGGGITVIAGVSGTDLILDTNGYYAPASTAGAKTVAVDCTMGQTIQAAINREDGPLVIDVHGICNENVNVIRKDVTLRGSDPVTDGIQGVVAVPQFAALRFRYVDAGRVENLSISNGPGIGVSAVFSHITVVNCRVTGNGGAGISLAEGTSVDATGMTVSLNQMQGAFVQRGAFFLCRECDFQNNGGFAAVARLGGFLTLHDSVVTGQRGLSSSFAAYADIDCISFESSHPCSLQVTGRAAQALGGGTVALYGAGDFTGQLQAADRGTVQLIGARQLATGQPGQGPTANQVDEFGTLSAGPDGGLSQLFGTTVVSGFGRVLLRDATTLAGSIQCDSAGDAWLDPTVVAAPGSVTGCEHGPP